LMFILMNMSDYRVISGVELKINMS
jgi:hypothetical protein